MIVRRLGECGGHFRAPAAEEPGEVNGRQQEIGIATMNLDLTPEQTMIRDVAREFAEKEVRPIAEAIDREARFPRETVARTGGAGARPSGGATDRGARFPRETVARMGELGLLGVAVPEAFGGSGGDTVSY